MGYSITLINIFQPKEINARTYMGIGKVEQIRDEVAELGIDVVIFDCPLTGSQLRNLGEIVGVTKVSVCGDENGSRVPSLEVFEMMAELFGTLRSCK